MIKTITIFEYLRTEVGDRDNLDQMKHIKNEECKVEALRHLLD